MAQDRSELRRSERSLALRAAAGDDDDVRLDSWSINDVESSLQKLRLPYSTSHVLELLEKSHSNQADSVRNVLGIMSHQAERHAVNIALVWRYAKEHQVWKQCSNPTFRTEKSFLDSLDDSQTVRICVKFGTSTDVARRSKIKIIGENWGTTWYESACERTLLPIRGNGVSDLSKGLLTNIASMSCNIGLERALDLWTQVINERTAVEPGKSTGWRNAWSSHLTPADFSRLSELQTAIEGSHQSSASKRLLNKTGDEFLELESSLGSALSSTIKKNKSNSRQSSFPNDQIPNSKSDRTHVTNATRKVLSPQVSARREAGMQEGLAVPSYMDLFKKHFHSDSMQNYMASGEHNTPIHSTGNWAMQDLANWYDKSLGVATDVVPTDPFSLEPTEPMELTPSSYSRDQNEQYTGSILTSLRLLYDSTIQEFYDESLQTSTDPLIRRQRAARRNWLEGQRWATIYADNERVLGSGCASREDADVWYLTWARFQDFCNQGHIFTRPVVLKQVFQDGGSYTIGEYLDILEASFPKRKIDVQNGATGQCIKMNIAEYCHSVRNFDDLPSDEAFSVSNAINLASVAEADKPLFTRMVRFRLLSILSNRLKSEIGKPTLQRATDVENSLEFNLLGFKNSFSGPHVDSLLGTWVRCLTGAKLWIITTDMNEEDWLRFGQEGFTWSPGDKARMIVLEQDDVLLMPPGAMTVHAVFTLEHCLMEGGMIWDESDIEITLAGIRWIIFHQCCTNEAVAYQLPLIIDSLEQWLEMNAQSTGLERLSDESKRRIQVQIDALRQTGCSCENGCTDARTCKCAIGGRRCTSWCPSHPSLPPEHTLGGKGKGRHNASNSAFLCMHEVL